jgi:hypothetical protein
MNRLIAAAALVFMASVALADRVAIDTTVRIEGSGIELGWHDGKITVTSEGCTMIELQAPTKDGYTLIGLIATRRIQRKQGEAWVELPIQALRASEPKQCLEDGAD